MSRIFYGACTFLVIISSIIADESKQEKLRFVTVVSSNITRYVIIHNSHRVQVEWKYQIKNLVVMAQPVANIISE